MYFSYYLICSYLIKICFDCEKFVELEICVNVVDFWVESVFWREFLVSLENRIGSLFCEFWYRVEVMILIWRELKFEVIRFDCFWFVYVGYVLKFFNVSYFDRLLFGDRFLLCDLFMSRFLDGFWVGD